MTYVAAKKRPSQTTAFKIPDIKREAEKDGAENNHQIALWAIDHSGYWRDKGYTAIIDNLEELDNASDNRWTR